MSKPLSAIALLVGAGASAGVVFCAMQLRQTNERLQRMDALLASMEKPAPGDPGIPAAGASSTNSTASTTPRIESWNDVVREVSQLREDIDAAKAGKVEAAKLPTGDVVRAPEAIVTPAGEPSEVLRKAVDDILAQKERERAEADKKRIADMAKARLDRTMVELTDKLGLTGQQRDQIQTILADMGAKQLDLWQNRKEGENPMQKSMDLRKESDVAVKAMLTGEQQTKYDEIMKTAYGGGMRITTAVESVPGGGMVLPPPAPAQPTK